jgi:hypothetical protein
MDNEVNKKYLRESGEFSVSALNGKLVGQTSILKKKAKKYPRNERCTPLIQRSIEATDKAKGRNSPNAAASAGTIRLFITNPQWF